MFKHLIKIFKKPKPYHFCCRYKMTFYDGVLKAEYRIDHPAGYLRLKKDMIKAFGIDCPVEKLYITHLSRI